MAKIPNIHSRTLYAGEEGNERVKQRKEHQRVKNEERETRGLIKQREGTIGLSDKDGNLSVRSQLMWKSRADRQTKNGFMVCHLYWSRLTSSLWLGERERERDMWGEKKTIKGEEGRREEGRGKEVKRKTHK